MLWKVNLTMVLEPFDGGGERFLERQIRIPFVPFAGLEIGETDDCNNCQEFELDSVRFIIDSQEFEAWVRPTCFRGDKESEVIESLAEEGWIPIQATRR